MFPTLFFNVLSVFLMMLPGYLVIKKGIIRDESLKDFSLVIVKVFYPCLIFSSITSNFTIHNILESWQLPFSVFLFFITTYTIGLIYTGFFKEKSVERKKSMLFQFTVNNYSFLPLAIIAKLYDEQHMAALIFSTLGAELVVWTLGMAILNTEKKQTNKFSLKRLSPLFSPPLIGIYFSMVVLWMLHLFNTSISEITNQHISLSYLYSTINQLGKATIPMSLLMVGGRMGKIKLIDLSEKDIWIVTCFRLIILPLVGIGLFKLFFGNHPFINVMLIVAVMPNSVASLVFGELYGADQKLMSGTVLITHLLALLSIPLFLMFLI